MSARTTVLLLALVVAVGGYLWWDTARHPGGREPRAGAQRQAARAGPPTQRPLLSLDPERVVRVRLSHAGSIREAERGPAGWPAPAIADLLQTLAHIGVLTDIAPDAHAAADYGLDPPRATAEIFVADAPGPLLVLLGNRNPPATAVYVRTGPDSPIALVGALVDWEFQKAFRAIPPAAQATPPAER